MYEDLIRAHRKQFKNALPLDKTLFEPYLFYYFVDIVGICGCSG